MPSGFAYDLEQPNKRLASTVCDPDKELEDLVELLRVADLADVQKNLDLIRKLLLDRIHRRVTFTCKQITELQKKYHDLKLEVAQLQAFRIQFQREIEPAINKATGTSNACYAFMKRSQELSRIPSYDEMRGSRFMYS